MPLAREQRTTLARVLRWSRSNGWVHDTYPHTWRSTDGQRHVRFDATEGDGFGDLVVDRMTDDPLRCRVAIVPVETPEAAVDVLAALGCVPLELSPMGRELLGDDDHARLTYRTLISNGQHRYMSTYCQHGMHDDCRRTCKCCEAPCVCDLCPHTVPEATEVKCLKRYAHEDHPPHRWSTSEGGWARCNGWPLLCAMTDDDADSFDGPASFIDAGQALADLVDGRVSPELAAEVLSKLARNGLIISVEFHDETTGGQAARINDVMDDLERIYQADDQ